MSVIKIVGPILLGIFIMVVLLLTVRGHAGNPTSQELNTRKWTSEGPFELSPERGRFALLYSFVEDNSLHFSVPVARFATPDLGYANGNYVSLFAPFVSFAMIPGYMLGKAIGLSQVGAYISIAFVALINAFLIRQLAIHLGARRVAANIAALVFVFATPAFSYAVTLYQHHVSTFLILLSLLVLFKWKSRWSLLVIWLLFAMSIPVDYPNLILMLPIALYATTKMLWIENQKEGIRVNLHLFSLLTTIAMIVPLLFYVWFSQGSYGKPLQLAGTVVGVDGIDSQGKPIDEDFSENSMTTIDHSTEIESQKSAVGFFQTRNILNGLYIHFLSPDRGIIYFTPIIFLAIFGSIVLWAKKQKELALMAGVIGANIVLYSMWGDPWGGWAFGSRYLIPTYGLAAILIGVAISSFAKKKLFAAVFLLLCVYSILVNTVGALTSSANPPQTEISALERQTGTEQKYTYERNIDYLVEKGSKSFVYSTYLAGIVTPVQYYLIISLVITMVVGGMTVYLFTKKHD